MRSPGFVYVMVNPRAPQFVRVGKSTRPPEDTAQEANMQLRDAAYFADCNVAEGFVHDYLDTFHTSQDPELFEVPVEIALKALSAAMERHVGTRTSMPSNTSLYDDEAAVGDGTTSESLYNEGVAHRAAGNFAEALRYFKRAARLTEPRSFLALAEMSERGEGQPADPNKAVEWLNEGAKSGARECWGALADRLPQVKYLQPYFKNIDISGYSPEQRQTALRRLRLYLQLASNSLGAEDVKIIGFAVQQFNDPDLDREHKRFLKNGPVKAGGGMLKWILALGLAGALGILIPLMMNRSRNNGVDEQEGVRVKQGQAIEDEKAGPQPQDRAAKPKKFTPSQANSKVPAPVAPPAAPVIHGVAPVEVPKQDSHSWVTKTAPTVEEAPQKREISGEELREQFVWAKEKADAAFIDSVVKVNDVVTKVGKHDLSFKKIKCKFDGDPPARVQVGDTVAVEGTVKGKGRWTGNISLEHCRVLP